MTKSFFTGRLLLAELDLGHTQVEDELRKLIALIRVNVPVALERVQQGQDPNVVLDHLASEIYSQAGKIKAISTNN